MRLMHAGLILGLSPFLAGGLFLVGKGIANIRQAGASVHWPKTESVVSRSSTVASTSTSFSDKTTNTSYSADLEFKYRVEGKDYATSIRHFGQTDGSTDSSEAELLRLRYPAGARVQVSYDPANPSVAAAEPGYQPDLLWLPGAGFFFVAPALMFLLLFLRDDSPGGLGPGIVMFGAIFCLLGACGLIYGGSQLLLGRQSAGWLETTGEIVYGKLDTSESLTKTEEYRQVQTSYGANLIYKYAVQGQTYYSNRRSFGQLAGSDEEWAAEIMAKYPPGARIPVSYSSDNPHLAVLEPGTSSEAFWLPGAGLASLLFGAAAMTFARKALTGGASTSEPARSRRRP